MKVYALDSVDWKETEQNGLERERAVEAIERGLREVSELLPGLSQYLTIIVRPHFQHIIPEYGTGGYTYDSELIEITIDKAVPHGVEKTLTSLYETVFHEGNHAARYNTIEFDPKFMNSVITEGLATVFERDYAKYQPLYGKYEDDATMRQWFEELRASDWDKRQELFFDHPDGRRWIAYKTGTWLVDNVVQNSGKTVPQLTGLSCDEILNLAKL